MSGGVVGHEGANHHTQAVQNKRSQEQRDAWKERLDVGQIVGRLARAANGIEKMEASEIKAGEVVLDRFLPRLSAVEQTEVNELDRLSREDILLRIQSLLRSDPTLLPELVGLEARNLQSTEGTTVVTASKK